MEMSILRDLVNNLSHFTKSFSSINVHCTPLRIYFQDVSELLKLMEPVLRQIESEGLPIEQLSRKLEELNSCVDDANKLMEEWHPLTSKIYNILPLSTICRLFFFQRVVIAKLLQSEVVAAKIQALIEAICIDLSSLTLSASASSNITCIQKHEWMSENHISPIIRRAIQSQGENVSPEALSKIANCLSLLSSHELLMESVALEKAKLEAMYENKTEEMELLDQIISLVGYMHDYMHDRLVKAKQSQTVNGVTIPADLCCPLSLEPMSDPVIVASGQTYERAYIRKWLDLGLTVCPRTRQNISHTNLIPNFTVKALIANWCELNHFKLPDPVKSINSNQSYMFLGHMESVPPRLPIPAALESVRFTSSVDERSSSGKGVEACANELPPSQLDPCWLSNDASAVPNKTLEVGEGALKVSLVNDNDGMPNRQSVNSPYSTKTLANNDSEGVLINRQFGQNQSTLVSSAATSSTHVQVEDVDGDVVSSRKTNGSTEVSSAVASNGPSSSAPRSNDPPIRLPELPTRNQPSWRRSIDRNFIPWISSSLMADSTSNTSEIEDQVKKLVEDLHSTSLDAQRSAAIELRCLTKHNTEDLVVIARCGVIQTLVQLLYSEDIEIQENVVTALLNLSINVNNKAEIVNAGAIEPLVHALKTGSDEAKANSAATFFSFSVINENKAKIGRSDAIYSLVELLSNGTPQGKRDAAIALFNLSTFHENKARIVQAGAVKHLLELMDPAAGMVDKAVTVLSNLSTIQEGRDAIGQEGGIPLLVEVVELGSSRGKENAAATLLQLCIYSPRFSNTVLHEGVVPPLVALSQSGTGRAKEKMVDCNQCLLPANELAKVFEEEGLCVDNPFIASCGTGVTACILALGLHRLGQTNVPVYDGSWTEWGAYCDTPISTSCMLSQSIAS